MSRLIAPVEKENLDPEVLTASDPVVLNHPAWPFSQSIAQASLGSIAGELDRTVSHSQMCWSTAGAFDLVVGQPKTIAVCIIDLDPPSSSIHQSLLQWHGSIDASRDGAILPIIRPRLSTSGKLNGSDSLRVEEIKGVLKTCGYLPFVIRCEVLGEVNEMLHAKVRAALWLIKTFQQNARRTGSAYSAPRWPAILIG